MPERYRPVGAQVRTSQRQDELAESAARLFEDIQKREKEAPANATVLSEKPASSTPFTDYETVVSLDGIGAVLNVNMELAAQIAPPLSSHLRKRRSKEEYRSKKAWSKKRSLTK